jgi:hypothetical protein
VVIHVAFKVSTSLAKGGIASWESVIRDGELLYFSITITGASLGDYLLSNARHSRPLGIGMAFFSSDINPGRITFSVNQCPASDPGFRTYSDFDSQPPDFGSRVPLCFGDESVCLW